VDGRYNQDLVLFGDGIHAEYPRLLGCLPAGAHVLSIDFNDALSAPRVSDADITAAAISPIPGRDRDASVLRRAPAIYWRDLSDPRETAMTDTPLVLFTRTTSAEGRRSIEYHLVSSHEDEGTPLLGLLAKWGHTTDIEWIYRVTPADETGPGRWFQGPGHRTNRFRGKTVLGGHPALQLTTRHGMVTDRITGRVRSILPPAIDLPHDEPREATMTRFPWTYQVSVREVRRQVLPLIPSPGDPREYLYLQFRPGPIRPRKARLAFEAGVRLRGEADWRWSSLGAALLCFAGHEAWSTAVRIPIRTRASDIEVIALRAEPAGSFGRRCTVRTALFAALLLDQHDRATAVLRAPGPWVEIAAGTTQILWNAATGRVGASSG